MQNVIFQNNVDYWIRIIDAFITLMLKLSGVACEVRLVSIKFYITSFIYWLYSVTLNETYKVKAVKSK